MTIRQGFVGAKLASGEVVLTLSGRKTTPFPKFKAGAVTGGLFKKIDKWLIQNAYDEAVSREDSFKREGQLEYAPKEDWGGYIRSETEYCYNLWREEIEKMKAAKEEGNVYEINYTHIWGNPYN